MVNSLAGHPLFSNASWLHHLVAPVDDHLRQGVASSGVDPAMEPLMSLVTFSDTIDVYPSDNFDMCLMI